MRNDMSLHVPAAMTDLTTGPPRSRHASPTDYAEHVNPDSSLALPTSLLRTSGNLRMPRVVFLRFATPLTVSLRVDYSSTMIPQILLGRRGQLSRLSPTKANGSAHKRDDHEA